MSEQHETFTAWAVLEIMGRRRFAGKVSEQVIAGQGFIRIDIPGEGDAFTTQFYGPSSVYAITPTTEELARRFATSNQPQPISRWELPEPRRPTIGHNDDDDDYDGGDIRSSIGEF